MVITRFTDNGGEIKIHFFRITERIFAPTSLELTVTQLKAQSRATFANLAQLSQFFQETETEGVINID